MSAEYEDCQHNTRMLQKTVSPFLLGRERAFEGSALKGVIFFFLHKQHCHANPVLEIPTVTTLRVRASTGWSHLHLDLSN